MNGNHNNSQKEDDNYRQIINLSKAVESSENKPENATEMISNGKVYRFTESSPQPKMPTEDLKGGRWVDDKERGFRGRVMRFTENPEAW